MGGSGGGGGTGAVTYPPYMQAQHSTWLSDVGGAIMASVNPYIGFSAYAPDVQLNLMIQCMDDLIDYLDAIDSPAAVTAGVAAYGTILLNEINSKTIPDFEAGMRDINAVQSSAFVIGRALLYARKDDQIAKYAADVSSEMKLKLAGERRLALVAFTEVYRHNIIAKKEEYEHHEETEALYAKWELGKWTAGGDMLASISGAATSMLASTQQKVVSGLSGAMTGISMGSSQGGWGEALGGITGGLLGFFGR